jgi:hypothetical protein
VATWPWAQLDLSLRERTEALETLARRERWIEDHVHLLGEYTDVHQELDRRVAARAMLHQADPPEGLVEQIGARSEASDPQAWDSAVMAYARTRLELGAEIDLNDLPTHLTGPWLDTTHALHSIEEPAPVIRLTG